MSTEQVPSPVTGLVWKCLAAVGGRLNEGDTILLIESMKMEIPVDMPRAGVLKAILVNEEDSVAEGQAVAEIEWA